MASPAIAFVVVCVLDVLTQALGGFTEPLGARFETARCLLRASVPIAKALGAHAEPPGGCAEQLVRQRSFVFVGDGHVDAQMQGQDRGRWGCANMKV